MDLFTAKAKSLREKLISRLVQEMGQPLYVRSFQLARATDVGRLAIRENSFDASAGQVLHDARREIFSGCIDARRVQPRASFDTPHCIQDACGWNVAPNFESCHDQRDNDGITTMARKLFTPDDPALPMNYPGFVFRTLLEDGYPADILLAETGLDAARFSDPRFRCGFAPLRRLFLNAIEQTGNPNLGIGLARQFQPTYIGMPSYTAMNAARFREGLDVLTRFFFLNFPAFEVRLVDNDTGLQPGEAALRLRSKFPFEDIEYFGFSSAIVAINGLLKAMLQSDHAATRAEMTVGQPKEWPAMEAEIGFPVRFAAAENQIIFPAVLLDRPLPGADPINHARLLGLCEQFAEEMAFETTPVTQVMAILEGAPSLMVSLSDVAAELGYSERGLRRQLGRSGSSYRKLLDHVREQRARALLSGGIQPIKAIAGALGFESSSNFARSFKRWTGLTPKVFREQALTLDDADRK